MGDGWKRAVGAAAQSRLPIKVKVGQVWEDNDSRIGGAEARRRVKIVRIEGDVAVCENVATKRATKIKLSRFRPNATGYRLIS